MEAYRQSIGDILISDRWRVHLHAWLPSVYNCDWCLLRYVRKYLLFQIYACWFGPLNPKLNQYGVEQKRTAPLNSENVHQSDTRRYSCWLGHALNCILSSVEALASGSLVISHCNGCKGMQPPSLSPLPNKAALTNGFGLDCLEKVTIFIQIFHSTTLQQEVNFNKWAVLLFWKLYGTSLTTVYRDHILLLYYLSMTWILMIVKFFVRTVIFLFTVQPAPNNSSWDHEMFLSRLCLEF